MTACEICSQIPAALSVNVDDPLPEAARKLTHPFWFEASLPGMEGFGLERCPACQAWYYTERERSLTGSQTHDFQHFYRLNAAEAGLLGLPPGADSKLPAFLEKVLGRMCNGQYRGDSTLVVAGSVLQTLPELGAEQAAAAAAALRVIAATTPENALLILDAAKRFFADAKHPEIARLLDDCRAAPGS